MLSIKSPRLGENWIKIILPLVAALFAALPWFYGRLEKPAQSIYYAAYLKAAGDTSVYYRYIDAGRTGGPLMTDAFTTEPQQPVLWEPLWWVLGRLAVWFNISTPTIFALARVVLAAGLAAVVQWAAKIFFSEKKRQILAAWLGYFGGGLGGLMYLIARGATNGWAVPVYDLWVSEGYPWLSSLASPHFLLVTAGLLFVVVGSERAWSGRWVRWLVGPALLVTTSIHPFHLLTLGVFWSILTATDFTKNKREMISNMGRRFMVAIWALPTVIYYMLTANDPLIFGRAIQNINPTYFWPMLVGLSPLLLVVLISISHQSIKERLVLWAWLASVMLVVFLPLDWPRRMFQGIAIPVGFLAAGGLARWISRGSWRLGLAVMVVALSLITPFVVIGQSVAYLNNNLRSGVANYSYLTAPYPKLIAFLKANANTQPILASRFNGNILAAWSPITTYLGHGVETLQSQKKSKEIELFFGQWPASEQHDFVRREKICSIVLTPYEKTYGNAFPGEGWAGLQKVFSELMVEVYTTGVCD